MMNAVRDFDYAIVADPEIFAQNRLRAHSDHDYYEREPGDCRVSLNGVWKFSYARCYADSIKGFERTDYDCSAWDDIRVPAHIQMEGYGRPGYVNIQYPWDGHEQIDPGQIPARFNPTASYVTCFSVPEKMRGHRLFISFQGVESGFALWLNGSYVGYSEDSFTPSEFELTHYLNPDPEGRNKLAVQVFRFTSGSWCEDQDFFRFSGIFRDVYLYVIPQLHVRDLKVQTLVDEPFDHAELVIGADVIGAESPNASVRVSLQETGAAGQAESVSGAAEIFSGTFAAGGEIRVNVRNPKLWSAEKPNLYLLTLQLTGADGAVREHVKQPVGFRRFEIDPSDHVMKLNGKRIVFRGVNRHEFCAQSGRVVSEEMIRKDLITMKRNNINAVRTSHYPNRSELYRLCDELGLYLIDETNMETHGTWVPVMEGRRDPSYAVPGDRPEFLNMVLDRARSMYERDKNHPGVLIWSCGNESYGGRDIFEMSRLFHRLDPTRPVHYEGIFNDRRYPDTSDMESTMYASVADIRAYLKTHRDKPYINCEYAHAMGNSCGGLQKYTDLTQEDPLYQGGFIWDYIDQSITKKDRYGAEFQAYGGDFDERPTDWNFSGDGIVYGKDRDPSPKMQEVKYCYQNLRIDVKKAAEARDRDQASRDNIDCGGADQALQGDAIDRSSDFPAVRPDQASQGDVIDRDSDFPAVRPDQDSWDGTLVACVTNLYQFTDAADFRMLVLLEREGHRVSEQEMTFSLAPLSKTRVTLPVTIPADGAEYAVTVSFRLREDTRWAPAGHEVAYGQGVFTRPVQMCRRRSDEPVSREMACGQNVFTRSAQMRRRRSDEPASREMTCGKNVFTRPSQMRHGGSDEPAGRLTVTHGLYNLGVRGEHVEVLFSLTQGALVSYRYAGRELFEDVPRPDFWRAMTDNDIANQLPFRAGQWKAAGMYASPKYDHGRKMDPGTVKEWEEDGTVQVTFPYHLPVRPQTDACLSYTVHADGLIDVSLKMGPSDQVGQLPAFSVLFTMNADFDRFRWYGLGPSDTYPDRNHGRLGIYETKVKDQLAKYLVPQECGNKMGVRWATITDEKERGLLVLADRLDVNVLPWTAQELDSARHPNELPPVHHTYVKVGRQMGVGGDDTWGALVHPEYLLDNSREMEIRFSFRGI